MRAKAYELFDNARKRAFSQLQYVMQREQADGNYGTPYKYYEDGEQKECFVYSSNWYALRLMDWGGDKEQPCFYNFNLGKWDTVYNMPVERLVECSDYMLKERQYRKRNNPD